MEAQTKQGQGVPLSMIGKKKGMLTIIEFSHSGKNNNKYWNAKCECGKFRNISTGEWNRNRSPVISCGCYRKIEDLVGSKFNYLEVVRFDKRVKSVTFWWCKCICGKEVLGDSYSLKVGRKKSCGCITQIKINEKIKNIKKLFLEKIDKKSNDCWEWTGYIAPNGYGRCPCKTVFSELMAHRQSYIIFVGEIPDGMWVLHKCDNKKCVNPDHLYLGTVRDNVKDAIQRGFWPVGKNKKKGSCGEKNIKSKLKNFDVLKIRKSKIKSSLLAKKYNVNVVTIQSIRRGKTWTHI